MAATVMIMTAMQMDLLCLLMCVMLISWFFVDIMMLMKMLTMMMTTWQW